MSTKKPGRPPVPAHLRREKLEGVRIQQWRIDWLKKQPRSRGRSIELALDEIIPKEEVKR